MGSYMTSLLWEPEPEVEEDWGLFKYLVPAGLLCGVTGYSSTDGVSLGCLHQEENYWTLYLSAS